MCNLNATSAAADGSHPRDYQELNTRFDVSLNSE